eukprot:TRINITY_DN1331_c0_g1_i11.p16 TRINITY_DN1331_c0_g1~~TRINITY_DN1331_c0_g1_i11.p16  ORF type:complete len:102 (-),score=3.14 TRINITY_DN1331_c0_g1_i11:960-1265(-)
MFSYPIPFFYFGPLQQTLVKNRYRQSQRQYTYSKISDIQGWLFWAFNRAKKQQIVLFCALYKRPSVLACVFTSTRACVFFRGSLGFCLNFLGIDQIGVFCV